jgi:hypothetical protein
MINENNLDEILEYLVNLQTNITNLETLDKQTAISLTKVMILIMDRILKIEEHMIRAAVANTAKQMQQRANEKNESQILIVPASALEGK